MSSAITQPEDQTSAEPASALCPPRMRAPELTDVGRVVGRAKDKLRRSVVPRADVRDVGLSLDQDLCAVKVAQLEDAGRRVEEEVLRLDVAVADPDRVDVGEGTEELVHVELDVVHRHRLLELGVVTRRAVDGFGDVFEDEV